MLEGHSDRPFRQFQIHDRRGLVPDGRDQTRNESPLYPASVVSGSDTLKDPSFGGATFS